MSAMAATPPGGTASASDQVSPEDFAAIGLLTPAEHRSRDLPQVWVAARRRLKGLEGPILAALDQQHVDQPHDTLLAEPGELG